MLNPEASDEPCELGITYTQFGNYVLGDIFLRNYVVQFDYESLTMKLAVNTNAYEGTYINVLKTQRLLIALFVAFGVSVLAFIIFAWFCCF